MTNNSQILEEIKNSFGVKQRLIPFVGAGFSKNIDNYPTWDNFIQLLKSDLNLDTVKERAFDNLPNNLEKTEYFIREIGKLKTNIPTPSSYHEYKDIYAKGRKYLVEKIRTIFDDNSNPFDATKWSAHLLLLEKFSKMIYTTNWDNSLERGEINRHDSRLNPKENYAFSKKGNRDGKPRIIKYHGDCQPNGESMLVACLTDYQRRMTFNNCLDIKLKSDLLRYDFLMLGYSFADPNIHLMIHHLSEIIVATNETAGGNHIDTSIYMVVLEKPDDLRVNLLKDTFYMLKPYHLLESNDYTSVCTVNPTSACLTCETLQCPDCGVVRCKICGHKCGSPIGRKVKDKTEAFLRYLT